MDAVIPIPTLHLFSVLDKQLINLLNSLSPQHWDKPTVARLWTVKDVAAHLLDGNVRGIAALNDYEPPVPVQINSYQDLVNYLNQLNASWVGAMKRVSPQLLIQQLKSTGEQYIAYLHTLEPFAQAKYAVAWAGENTSLNWFHIAREYTEKWHHQQQIRDAVGMPGLMTKELFYPCMQTFMYALPHAYRNVAAKAGSLLKITISGEAGGEWYLQKAPDGWKLLNNPITSIADAEVIVDPDTAWKFFTKAITPAEAGSKAVIKGDENLALAVFSAVAVMA